MKRVTIYTIGQEQREVAGDWVRIRTELQRLHPIQPWNVDPHKDDTAVALADEHAEIIRVRRVEDGRFEDVYVAIQRKLAQLLIPALQPAAQKMLENEIRDRKADVRRLEHRLAVSEADANNRGRELANLVKGIGDFLSLPWHKRLWRAWKGRL